MSRLQNPWPADRSINKRSPYGWRVHPITRKRTFHHGVDVAGKFPVTAAADGVVTKVGWAPKGGGHTVLIDHGDLVTVYYHGAHKTPLKVGQRVSVGEFVYQSGSTGMSTGAHLHFEVRRPGGKSGDTMNPEDFLPKSSVRAQAPVSTPEPPAEPVAPVESVRPAQPIVEPQSSPKPISAGLKRFFDMQKALKRGK